MSQFAKRPRVLMIAFACNPVGSGEHWLGWGWAEQAAKFCDVTLLTWDRYGDEIKPRAHALGIRAVCVGVPPEVNEFGDRNIAGRWFRQLVWHRRIAAVGPRLHAEQPFDLAHQTTFHTFRIPFLAAGWGIPAVWGPIAGGESCPPGFGPWLGRSRYLEASRKTVNRLALYHLGVLRSLRAADTIFVSNHTTLNFLPARCRHRCLIVPPNAVREDLPSTPRRTLHPGTPLKLLFVGNCVATRALPIIFTALTRLPKLPWHLTIVGGGVALPDWKNRVANLGLNDRVTFTGVVPRAEMTRYYEQADVFVFPALRDSGGSGMLEAMTSGLPVVCCDWGGPAEMVDDQSGIKVSVASPEAAIAGFATAFERLHADPDWRMALGQAAATRAREEFSWAKKLQVLETTYARCLGASR